MKKKKQEKEQNSVSRKKLADLNARLEGVTRAWTADDYESLLEFFIGILPKLMHAERCTIYIIELGTDKIYSQYGTGLKGRRIEPPREGSIAGEVISTGRGMINNAMNRQEGFHRQVDAGTGFVSRNTACVPIKSLTGQGVTGAIQVLNKRDEGQFDKDDLDLLSQVASYLSMSIENIIINQEILRISGQLNREVEKISRGYFRESRFIAESAPMLHVLELVKVVCAAPVGVLLQGENGTGKELVARMVHRGSSRRDMPFVAVNCASIPENLMESEFFGYEKGAFTGAERQRKGLFEEAEGGTLFLDEIGDLPAVVQPKFLRAIQEKEGARLGSNKTIKYDFRLISATNKRLQDEVAEGRFREDLFFRLFSVEINIPPLRERKEDILPLALAFLADVSERFEKHTAGFSSDVTVLFEKFDWPGNVRQLQREVERLVALTPENSMILPRSCSSEIQLIEDALLNCSGNKVKAAGVLGITRQGLHKKMKRYGLDDTEKL